MFKWLRNRIELLKNEEKAFIDRLNVNDYRRPFMTEEEVKAFNDERKQHLKNKIKKVDEEIERVKTKPTLKE